MVDTPSAGDRAWASGIGIFAGTMLATLGVFSVLEGISAVSKDSIYRTRLDYTLGASLSTWGWIHVVIGALAVAIGVCIVLGQHWALVAGICVALVSALASFAFMVYYPFWALAIIAFDIMVIWAMTTLMASRGSGRRPARRH